MKKTSWIVIASLLAGMTALAEETDHHDHTGCSHDHEHATDAHAEHSHNELGNGEYATEGQTGKSAPHAEHEKHDHIAHSADAQSGCSHDHEDAGLSVSPAMAEKIGLQVFEAEAGTISLSAVFPAEIKLNRDRSAEVSARYASVVRQVFAEIGDEVKKDDVLASLENRETLAVYTVSAPLDGVVVSKNISVGESAGDADILFEVADLSSVWADISIFPKYHHRVRKGMMVELIAHDGHKARGTIKYVSPIVSHETRTFTARCVLVNAAEDFAPGAFVRARVSIGTVEVPVRIEREAVQTIDGETVVFVEGGHGYETRPVTLGRTSHGFVEIKSGLKQGERYVGAGAFSLKAEILTSGMDPHAGHGH